MSRTGQVRPRALVVEAWHASLSQRAASLLTLVTVAGMCIAVLLTSGRSVAAEEAVMSRLDSVATRTIIVRAPADAPLDARLVGLVGASPQVQVSVGLGAGRDAKNAALQVAAPVALRTAYGLGQVYTTDLVDGEVVASSEAAQALGFLDGVGAVDLEGDVLTVQGVHQTPPVLRGTEPVLLVARDVPRPEGAARPDVTTLVVVASSVADVRAVTTLVTGMLDDYEPGQITVETSSDLAAISAAVAGDLGAFSRQTVLGVLAVCGALVAANLFVLVTIRRRDFGRRRALGATRSLIVSLLLAQVALLAAVGATLGSALAVGALALTGGVRPSWTYVVAIGVLAVVAAGVAALAPALIAARRDPLGELRVP